MKVVVGGWRYSLSSILCMSEPFGRKLDRPPARFELLGPPQTCGLSTVGLAFAFKIGGEAVSLSGSNCGIGVC